MTIPTTTGASRYTGDGATSQYNYSFYIQDDDDIEVIVTSTADVDTTLTKTTHYTVSGVGASAGGSITLIAPYANLTDGYSLAIRLKPALNNSSSFRNDGRLNLSAIEDAIDRLSQADIRQQDEIDRCLKLPVKVAGTAAATIVADATDRASKYFTFDSSGNPSAATAVAEGSLAVTAIGETIVEAANASAVLDALGFTTLTKTIVDDTTAGAVLTTLGISASAQTILDDASVAAIRTTLGIDGASGVIAALDLADAATAQIFQARLTLTSGTSVSGDVAAATTIYLTPHNGNKIAVYDGTRWKLMALTEISIAVPATTVTMYDLWVYDNSGTLTLEATAWTNDTTRATALALQDGVYCKTGSLTRRYVGSFRTTGVSGQTQDGTSVGVCKRFLWNYYNRAPRSLVLGGLGSWTYTTATIHAQDGNAARRVEFVVGVLAEAQFSFSGAVTSSNTSSTVDRISGFGLDSTTGFSGFNPTICASASQIAGHWPRVDQYILSGGNPGYHYISWNEVSEATGTTTWTDTHGTFGSTGGASGTLMA